MALFLKEKHIFRPQKRIKCLHVNSPRLHIYIWMYSYDLWHKGRISSWQGCSHRKAGDQRDKWGTSESHAFWTALPRPNPLLGTLRWTSLYWVGQKVHSGFFAQSYRKTQMNFFANPVFPQRWRMWKSVCRLTWQFLQQLPLLLIQ